MNYIVTPAVRAGVEQALELGPAVPVWYTPVKRILDIVIALTVLIVFSPVWLLLALLIKVVSPGPVFFIADAIGKDGQPFRLYKFRTMRLDGGESSHREYLSRFIHHNEPFTVIKRPDGTEERVYKIVNDSRIIPFGRLLRSTGLDEIPQLVNVIRGDMSLIGPRPPRQAEFAHYKEWHKNRLRVLPGITGLYQVTARSTVPFEEMVRIDLDYIRNRSLWLDLRILFVTPFIAFILRKGGY